MEIIRTGSAMQARTRALRDDHKTIAFVPTMGFLHAGHLALMRTGQEHGDILVVSIFVNPTQFGPSEDLEAYPRDMERDLDLLEEVGADIVFTPEPDDIYTPGFQTYVSLEYLPNRLCGLSRPVHFRGVATVVAKLFNIVQPHTAVFGQKDYQQYVIIKRMVKDLGFDIQVIGAPTVREPDGLALSSRNAYLKTAERESAPCLYRALNQAARMVTEGVVDAREIISQSAAFIEGHTGMQIDYIAIVDPDTLEDVTQIDRPVQMALAVKIGKTRLIDNLRITI
ncbi:MAG: pantoate--beta-alanine ligase [Desulfobacterales bacterium]|nr:pantoate--beta-alanine ligase [Desulfobacterales bacterium]